MAPYLQFFLDSGLNYKQYLNGESFLNDVTTGERAILGQIDKSTHQLIGSMQEFSDVQLGAMQSHADRQYEAIQANSELIYWSTGRLSEGLEELNATFHWGFSEVLTKLGRMGDTMDELLHTMRNPTKTRAYEFFEDARTAFRLRLFRESLRLVRQACTEYEIEWRFHMLKGTLRLGGADWDHSVIDLVKAENDFVLARRYAEPISPRDAARASLAAGWAAYCLGKLPEAMQHTDRAIALSPALNEAWYQKAKIHMALGAPKIGLNFLERAVAREEVYLLKAAADGDFQRYKEEFEAFVKRLISELATQVTTRITALETLLSNFDTRNLPRKLASLRESKSRLIKCDYAHLRKIEREVLSVTKETVQFLQQLHEVYVARERKARQKVLDYEKESAERIRSLESELSDNETSLRWSKQSAGDLTHSQILARFFGVFIWVSTIPIVLVVPGVILIAYFNITETSNFGMLYSVFLLPALIFSTIFVWKKMGASMRRRNLESTIQPYENRAAQLRATLERKKQISSAQTIRLTRIAKSEIAEFCTDLGLVTRKLAEAHRLEAEWQKALTENITS